MLKLTIGIKMKKKTSNLLAAGVLIVLAWAAALIVFGGIMYIFGLYAFLAGLALGKAIDLVTYLVKLTINIWKVGRGMPDEH